MSELNIVFSLAVLGCKPFDWKKLLSGNDIVLRQYQEWVENLVNIQTTPIGIITIPTIIEDQIITRETLNQLEGIQQTNNTQWVTGCDIGFNNYTTTTLAEPTVFDNTNLARWYDTATIATNVRWAHATTI